MNKLEQTGEQGIALEDRPGSKTMIMIMIRWKGLDQPTSIITKTIYKDIKQETSSLEEY